MGKDLSKTIFLQVGGKRYQVASYAQASAMFCRARDESGFGGSKIKPPTLVDEDGETIGYVSYNGRVWSGAPKDWRVGQQPLFDNRV